MRYDTKVTVFLHSDAVIEDCDGPASGPFVTLDAAMDYAVTLSPRHPEVTRSLQPDRWGSS